MNPGAKNANGPKGEAKGKKNTGGRETGCPENGFTASVGPNETL